MTDPVVHHGPSTAEYRRKHGLWSTPRVFRGPHPANSSIAAQLRECLKYPGRSRRLP